MMAEIEGKWQLDDNVNVTILKVIEVPSLIKREIYERVLEFFTYNNKSGKAVIQIQDEYKGLIIGKGIY